MFIVSRWLNMLPTPLCILVVSILVLTADVTHGNTTPMDDTMNHTMEHSMDDMAHEMKMYFHASAHSTVLFKGWMTMNWWEMLLSCIFWLVIAALYEGLKAFREQVMVNMSSTSGSQVAPGTTKFISNSQELVISERSQSPLLSICSPAHLVQVPLHIMQVFLSYCLMLVFMTFNVYLCLSITLGAGLGYFLFAWKRHNIQDTNEHCH